MRILLTNDDGINAPGLTVLEKIAAQFSDDIWICAPHEEQSGAGHSLTLTQPVRLRQHAAKRFSVTGTPTDAVTMALRKVLPAPPDLILSGVNRGANLGDDITYSGTVAAALEGIVLGIPAIAISQQSGRREMDFNFGRDFDFAVAAALAAGLVQRAATDPLPADTLLNVNCPAGEPTGIEVTHLGKRLYNDEMKLIEEDPEGRKRYQIYGFEPSFEDEPGTDLAAVARGRVAITPLHFDLTDRDGLEGLRSWDIDAMLAASLAGETPATR